MKADIVREFRMRGLDLPEVGAPEYTSFHYVDLPIDDSLLEDGAMIDSGVYEFAVRDAVLAVFETPIFEDEFLYWSLSSTRWVDVLAAVKVGETLDVVFEQPFEQVFHVSKSHFPSGAPDSGYGEYAIHLSVDVLRPDWFRVVSSFEPQSRRSGSRLPFFFGFRIYGESATDRSYPVWRVLFSDALRQGLYGRWQHALLYMAFALESFIDHLLVDKLKLSGLGEDYIRHALQVGERKRELHALNSFGPNFSKSRVNKVVEQLNNDVFGPRNQIAHGQTIEVGNPAQFMRAMKASVEFIWDWDVAARGLLIPVLPASSPQLMIDEQLIGDCLSE